MDIPVIIVGAGPAGLSTSIMLSRLSVPSLLVASSNPAALPSEVLARSLDRTTNVGHAFGTTRSMPPRMYGNKRLAYSIAFTTCQPRRH